MYFCCVHKLKQKTAHVPNAYFRPVPVRVSEDAVATDLLPLAVLKHLLPVNEIYDEQCCNRSITACGIETDWLSANSRVYDCCNRSITACGIENHIGRLWNLLLVNVVATQLMPVSDTEM